MTLRGPWSLLTASVGQTAMAAALAFATPAMAAPEAECLELLKRPDVYASGKLAAAYREALVGSGRAVAADGSVDRATIINGCRAGAFALVAVTLGGGAPFSGATSYTESQARDYIERVGFTSVSGLEKDSQGIWRATAMQDRKSVTVALDFKGNVVAK